MNKLEIAHEWFMKYGKVDSNYNRENTVQLAWDYADTMQAEADKRIKSEAEEKRKNVCEMLKADNTFLEREGQHFDDVNEWQPDWSQAPDGYDWWAMDRDGFSSWHKSKPNTQSGIYFWIRLPTAKSAPSFNYQGDWEDSLRKRPNT